eukprot:4486692-Amphidinium_carterae.1
MTLGRHQLALCDPVLAASRNLLQAGTAAQNKVKHYQPFYIAVHVLCRTQCSFAWFLLVFVQQGGSISVTA